MVPSEILTDNHNHLVAVESIGDNHLVVSDYLA